VDVRDLVLVEDKLGGLKFFQACRYLRDGVCRQVHQVQLFQAQQGHREAGQLVVVKVNLSERNARTKMAFGYIWVLGIKVNRDVLMMRVCYLRFFNCCSDMGMDWRRLNERFRFSNFVNLPVS